MTFSLQVVEKPRDPKAALDAIDVVVTGGERALAAHAVPVDARRLTASTIGRKAPSGCLGGRRRRPRAGPSRDRHQHHQPSSPAIAARAAPGDHEMTISVGDTLPNATFKTRTPDGPADMSTDEIFAGKKVVLFAVPGAFTPTCSMNHLPGFLDHNDEIRAKGVDTIAVVAVNDVFVMDAWEKANEASGKILFLSDGNGEFTRAVGLDIDLSVAGFGVRSKRYSMIVEDKVVKALNVEESPGQAEKSSAGAILEQL